MKKTLILPTAILLMAASVIVSAQGYKKEKLRLEYTSFPLEPLPEDYTTYYTEINPGGIDFREIEKNPPLAYTELTRGDGTVKTNYSSPEKAAAEYLGMRGYEWDEEDPDITFRMDFAEIDLKGGDEFVDREGNKNLKARYTFGAVFKAIDRDGNVLFEKVFSDSMEIQERTIGFGYKPQTLQEFYGDYQQELTVKYLEEAEGIIHSNYDYTLYFVEHIISTDRSTRKLNYDDLDSAVTHMQQAFALITEEERKSYKELYKDPASLEAIRAELDAAIAIWEKALEEADFQDRRARIHSNLAPMLYCNLATAHIYRKDWDKAAAEIEKALTYEESQYLAGSLQNRMKNLKHRYELHGIE